MSQTYDEWLKEQNKNSLSFKDALEASQTPAGKELTKPKQAKTAKKSNGGSGMSTSGKLDAAASFFSKAADMTPGSKWRNIDPSSLKTGEVKDNDGATKDSMDITKFSDAYGSRNTDTTGEDFGKMSDEERKKKYGF